VFEKIDELSDLFFGLLHACDIVEPDFDITLSLYFEVAFVGKFSDNSIRREPAEDENCDSEAYKGREERKCV